MSSGATDAGPSAALIDAAIMDAGMPDSGTDLTWRSAAPLGRGPRQETAVVAWRGEVVVLGGYDETQAFGTRVEAYDPLLDSWRDLPDLPVAMHHANAVIVDDQLWVVGFLGAGFREDGRIFMLGPSASDWQAVGEMPANRARGASVVSAYEGAIYIVGGLARVAPVAAVDRFDPRTGEWQSLPPIPRFVDHAVGAIIDGRFYVAGGRAGLIGAHTSDLDIFDLQTFEWSVGPSMPTSRGGAAAAVRDGVLFVMGGEGNSASPPSNLFREVESFDPGRQRWRSHAPLSPARHGMGAAAVNGRIYVPGGADIEAFGAVDTHQVLGE